MKLTAVHAVEDQAVHARQTALALDAPFRPIKLHSFPDGETLPRVAQTRGAVGVYCSLWRPNEKLVPLLLTADALRRAGAKRLILIAPYLCYLRQDAVFHPGESLSRDVIGALLGRAFDALVTVEPHLHRTRELSAAFAGIPALAISSAPLLGGAFAEAEETLLVVGPDAESAAWAGAVAQSIGREAVTFHKTRRDDREVELALPPGADIAGRPALLVDDVCASGATLEAALRALRARGALSVDIAVAHALFDPQAEDRLRRAGARRIVSTDSCPHPSNTIPLAAALAEAVGSLVP
jgi:ribose-phosphate pyrophosphokinase